MVICDLSKCSIQYPAIYLLAVELKLYLLSAPIFAYASSIGGKPTVYRGLLQHCRKPFTL